MAQLSPVLVLQTVGPAEMDSSSGAVLAVDLLPYPGICAQIHSTCDFREVTKATGR